MLSKFNYRHQSLPLFIIVLSASTITHASDGLWDMSLEELGKIRVSTLASGTATPLDKAVAITTVITAEDIAAMGARDIDEVLETVPGLHVGRLPFTPPKYTIRGITSTHTPQTLKMRLQGSSILSLKAITIFPKIGLAYNTVVLTPLMRGSIMVHAAIIPI